MPRDTASASLIDNQLLGLQLFRQQWRRALRRQDGRWRVQRPAAALGLALQTMPEIEPSMRAPRQAREDSSTPRTRTPEQNAIESWKYVDLLDQN
jgi:hypothetical protein